MPLPDSELIQYSFGSDKALGRVIALIQEQPPGTQRSTARVYARSGRQPERHLVIVHQPGWQAIEDWYGIAATIRKIDPGIATFVVSAAVADEVAVRQAALLPTLVFSPGPLGHFAPTRGKIYQGGTMGKFEQLRRLAEAGVRVPRSTVLRPDLKLDPAEWGEFVVVKPTDIGTSSQGKGFTLMRTERVRYIPPEQYPEGHPGRFGPMVVQYFVNTGPKINAYRVLTLFGQALYSVITRGLEDRPELSADDAVIESTIVATETLGPERWKKAWVYEADVIALAAAAYRAIPEAPLQGCDIIRDAATGTLYVLELNPGGNTWHFSSARSAEGRAKAPEFEQFRRTQLDAFGTAAHVLADRARQEAE